MKESVLLKRQTKLRKNLSDQNKNPLTLDACSICFPFISIYRELTCFINIKLCSGKKYLHIHKQISLETLKIVYSNIFELSRGSKGVMFLWH